MKGLMNKVRNVKWKELARESVELSVGTVGFVSVGVIEGAMCIGKYTVQGSVDCIMTTGKLCKEFGGKEAINDYKKAVKGFVIKEDK